MPKSRPRLNWSRPLPRPLVIPDVMKLATLADVRVLINKHLPKDRRDRRTWRVVTAELDKAAAGADTTGVANRGAPGADYRARRMSAAVTTRRRFPPPWTIEEMNEACFIVRDKNGQGLGYFYFEEEPGRRTAAKMLTKDEA